jgi:murein L,D-transpeptidase YafK
MTFKVWKLLSTITLTTLLAACSTVVPVVEPDSIKPDPRRGLAPQSPALISETEAAGAKKDSAVLIRIFKETKELELWRDKGNGKYVLVKIYPICSYSGHLGPKIRMGDRQAPEGFYSITAGQLNYQSVEFVSMNTGYPNAYDRAYGRTGAHLMIHGGCSSAGCYAIEHGPAQEVFTAVRDALKAGQKSVQLQIYPFRMTSLNLAAHMQDKNFPFWRELKVGYDRFELTHEELSVNVVNKNYIVN